MRAPRDMLPRLIMAASRKKNIDRARGGRRERATRLLGGAAFYGLLALVVLAAVPYGTVQPWWQALFECAVFALAALWLVESFLSDSLRLSDYRLLWPLAALAVFAWLQTLSWGDAWRAVSADPHGTGRWVSKITALILAAAVLLSYTRDERRLRRLIYTVVAVALASAVFGLVRQTTQREMGFVLPQLRPGFGYAQFINKNHFAFLMEMALGLVLGLVVAGGVARERRLILLGVALLLSGALASANSRGGILSLLCQLVIAAWLLFTVGADKKRGRLRRVGKSRVVRALLTVCLLGVVVVSVVWVGGDQLAGNFGSISTEVGSPARDDRWGVRRWDIWPATWRLIKDHPLAGVGFGGYWMAIPLYHEASGAMKPQEAHNDYLELLASGGVVGLALGVWFVFEFARRVRARLRKSEGFRRAAVFGALVGICGVAVHSVVDFGLHVTANALVFVCLVVIAAADVRGETLTAPAVRQ